MIFFATGKGMFEGRGMQKSESVNVVRGRLMYCPPPPSPPRERVLEVKWVNIYYSAAVLNTVRS